MHPLSMAQEADDEFCEGFLEWLVASDFVEVPWSTEFAAELFKVDKKVIYEALAKVAKKYPNRVHIMWSNGALAIAAE